MSMCIVCLCVLGVAKFTALNSSYAKHIIAKSGFGEKKSAELKTELVSYGNACNIGGDFFDEFFEKTLTPSFIENDVKAYYETLYYDRDAKIDTAQLELLLKESLLKYAEDKGYADEETLEEDIDLIAGEMGEIYSGVLSLPSVSTVTSLIIKLNRYCVLGLTAVTAVFFLTAFMILFMFKPKVYSVRYLIYAFSGAFLMLMALPLYLRVTNLIGKVNIVSKALYSFVDSFGNGVLDGIIISSCVCALITAVLVFAYIRLSKKAE
jgi:hypothetical protein